MFHRYGRRVRRLIAVMALGLTLAFAQTAAADFWSVQRRGVNLFNESPRTEIFAEAKAFGAGFARLAFDKWDGEGRDFLAGDLDSYTGLVAADLKVLRRNLDAAAKAGLPVVIAPLGLPGARWRQNNGGRPDLRLWQDKVWWAPAIRYWQDLAGALKGHPALVGYNILSAPAPELMSGPAKESEDLAERQAWCSAQAGQASDLDAFYRAVVAAIRAVDKTTPILLDTGYFAQPMAAWCLRPIADPKVLYAVHLHEPFAFTSHHNRGRYAYPGPVAFGGKMELWDKDRLRDYLKPLIDWAAAYELPRKRLMVGEFGCYRLNEGCDDYLADTIAIANEAKLSWAVYAFREDWDGYDYELGTRPLGWLHKRRLRRGEDPEPPRQANPLSELVSRALRGEPSKATAKQ